MLISLSTQWFYTAHVASLFFLENINAILEDWTESILRHADLWDAYIKSRKGREPNIDSKIKYIQKRAENKKDTLHKCFSDDLLDRVLHGKRRETV